MKTRQRVKLPPLHKNQQVVRDSPARFKTLCCGRRWGKSRLASALATAEALQGGRVWWLAPIYSVGGVGFRDLSGLAAQLQGTSINRSERLISYSGNGSAQVKTADDPAMLRGDSLDLVIVDEAAHTPRLEEIWTDVLRPALADRKGKAIFISTPNGRNFFWQLYQNGLDTERHDWQSFTYSTYDNPHIDNSEVDAMRATMPDVKFRQEILAEFIDGESVFRNVNELATAKKQDEPVHGHTYTAGIDWGRSNDYTVIVIYDVTKGCVAFYDRFSGIEFSQQLERVKTVIERFKPSTTTVELNSIGTPLFEQMQKMKLPTKLVGFTMTNIGKSELVDGLSLALEQRTIELLNDSVMKAELLAFEAEKTKSGLTRYTAPAGAHDDVVIALLLAYGPNAGAGPLMRKGKRTSWARM